VMGLPLFMKMIGVVSIVIRSNTFKTEGENPLAWTLEDENNPDKLTLCMERRLTYDHSYIYLCWFEEAPKYVEDLGVNRKLLAHAKPDIFTLLIKRAMRALTKRIRNGKKM